MSVERLPFVIIYYYYCKITHESTFSDLSITKTDAGGCWKFSSNEILCSLHRA